MHPLFWFQKFLSKVEETFQCICCQELVFRPITTMCQHNVCKVRGMGTGAGLPHTQYIVWACWLGLCTLLAPGSLQDLSVCCPSSLDYSCLPAFIKGSHHPTSLLPTLLCLPDAMELTANALPWPLDPPWLPGTPLSPCLVTPAIPALCCALAGSLLPLEHCPPTCHISGGPG